MSEAVTFICPVCGTELKAVHEPNNEVYDIEIVNGVAFATVFCFRCGNLCVKKLGEEVDG